MDINISENKGKHVLNFIIKELKIDKPVIVGINGQQMAHWLLAIGFEEDNESRTSKLFFLNPSEPLQTHYWNACINIMNSFHGRYPYKWIDSNPELLISFEHAMSISIK